jgi:hypothetical protein
LQGRLIYIEFEVKENVTVDESKEIGAKALDYFDEDEKAYYDIQIIITNQKDDVEGYPLMGYKHKTRDEIVW